MLVAYVSPLSSLLPLLPVSLRVVAVKLTAFKMQCSLLVMFLDC